MSQQDLVKLLEKLTKRQRDVLELVCDGLLYKQIGQRLHIAEDTVKSHMAKNYDKLNLSHLSQAEKKKALFEIIGPALDCEDLPPPPITESDDPEPVSEYLRKMVEEDEKALLVVRPLPEDIIEPVQPRSLSPFIRFRWFISGIFIGVILMGGLFASLVAPRIREQALAGQEIPTALVQVVDNTVEVIVKETVEVPVEVAVLITTTPEPTQPTITPIVQEIIITATTAPTLTDLPITPPDSILEVGEWWKGNGAWVRVSEAGFQEHGLIWLDIEFWNKTDNQLIFTWSGPKNFTLVDNTGHIYEIDHQSRSEFSEAIEPDQLKRFSNGYGTSVFYNDDFIYKTEVTDLYFTITDLSRIEIAKYHILAPK